MNTNQSGAIGRGWKQESPAPPANGLSAQIDPLAPRIAMIDMGPVLSNGDPIHRDLPLRVVEPLDGWQPPAKPSRSSHAVEVAGILTACCDAPIDYYNVFSESGLDIEALCSALERIETSTQADRARVLTLSIGIETGENAAEVQRIERSINKCLDKGVIVIAAAGESSKDTPAFPARIRRVVAVGGADPHAQAIEGCNRGVIILAPGEAIQVMQDDDSYRRQEGSSYAAPMVAAGAWLSIRKGLETRDEIVKVLEESAVKPDKPDPNNPITVGMLDLETLAEKLDALAIHTG